MARTSTKVTMNNPRVFEDAREAVIKLETLSRLLTPAELETLAILFDKRATALIAKSLKEETERGKSATDFQNPLDGGNVPRLHHPVSPKGSEEVAKACEGRRPWGEPYA
jgi:hypothetical protein